jgi:hypothetical protein
MVSTALLTGCSEKTEASTTLPTKSAAATTEALPLMGPADFPVPEEARTKDAAGAEAFLRYFIELSNRQQELLDGQPLRNLGPDCQECLRIARNFDEAAAAVNRYDGGEVTISAMTPPVIDGDTAQISFGARQEAVRLVDQAGNDAYPPLEVQPNMGSGIHLRWSEADHGWLVESFNLG